MTDYDGNVYLTRTYGTMEWMVENLRATHLRDGTPISHIVTGDVTLWNGAYTSLAYRDYDNDSLNGVTFGHLYNWKTATDSICPCGWHVPDTAEWVALARIVVNNRGELLTRDATGNIYNAGIYMKSTDYWATSATAGTNSSKFNVRPAGSCVSYENFWLIDTVADYWSKEELCEGGLKRSILFKYNSSSMILSGENMRYSAKSVRCMRYTPVLKVSGTSVTLSDTAGSSASISVTTNTGCTVWTATGVSSWFSVGQSVTSGNGVITIKAIEANDEVISRTDTVYVTSRDSKIAARTILVTQAGAQPRLSVSDDSVHIANDSSATVSVSVTSNAWWSILTAAAWLYVHVDTVNHNGTITCTSISANTRTTARAGILYITIGSDTVQTITVIQDMDYALLFATSNSISSITNDTLCQGLTAQLHDVCADNGIFPYDTICYQWQHSTDSVNWDVVKQDHDTTFATTGVFEDTLNIANVGFANEGMYRLVIGNSSGTSRERCWMVSDTVQLVVQGDTTVHRDTTLCGGEPLLLDGYTIREAGTYTHLLRKIHTGCDSIVVWDVTATPAITVGITGPEDPCQLQAATYLAGGQPLSWQLAGGLGTVITGTPGSARVVWNAPGRDTIIANQPPNGCSKTSYLPVTVHPIPTAKFTASQGDSSAPGIFYNNSIVSFANYSSLGTTSNRLVYWWDFGDQSGGESSFETSHYYDETGIYTVSLEVSDETYGCSDTAAKTITIVASPTCKILFPNTFTPDKDENTAFSAAVTTGVSDVGFSMKVYNRWGQLVWGTTKPGEGWDGTFKGHDCPQGVYVFQCVATCETGEEISVNNNVTLLR